MIDSRAARVLADGARDMVDADEWRWISEHARGSYDHLIIASTLPVFMLEAIHYLEAWNEAVCSGAWGRIAARFGERLRRALDLEHWPAFQRSFTSMLELLHELAEGPDAPGHDHVHRRRRAHRLHRRDLARGPPAEPGLPDRLLALPQPAAAARAAHDPPAPDPPAGRSLPRARPQRGRRRRPTPAGGIVTPVTFDNSIATLELDERRARVTIRRSAPETETGWPLEPLHERDLTPG